MHALVKNSLENLIFFFSTVLFWAGAAGMPSLDVGGDIEEGSENTP